MNYRDGQLVQLGDRVKLGGSEGIVVCSIDTNEFTPDFPREGWSHLGRGVMIEFERFGLIHYTEPEDDLELTRRA